MKCVSFWDRDVDKFAASYIVIIWSLFWFIQLALPYWIDIDFNKLCFFHVSATRRTDAIKEDDTGCAPMTAADLQ